MQIYLKAESKTAGFGTGKTQVTGNPWLPQYLSQHSQRTKFNVTLTQETVKSAWKILSVACTFEIEKKMLTFTVYRTSCGLGSG